jgi:hypothetical protein
VVIQSGFLNPVKAGPETSRLQIEGGRFEFFQAQAAFAVSL